MKKYTQVRKELIIGLIALFLSSTIVPILGSPPIEKEQSIMMKGCSGGIILSGAMGQNGWYVSPVLVTLDFPSIPIFYNIDQGGWQMYTVPIIVATEGQHTVICYYIDSEGNQSQEYSVTFKIDMTPPTVTIIVTRIGLFEIGVSVNASDNFGVALIEFYLDDSLMGSLTVPPYDFTMTIGLGEHTVKVIAYDFAGLNASSTVSTSYDLCYIQSNLLHQQIFRIFHNLRLLHQKLVR